MLFFYKDVFFKQSGKVKKAKVKEKKVETRDILGSQQSLQSNVVQTQPTQEEQPAPVNNESNSSLPEPKDNSISVQKALIEKIENKTEQINVLKQIAKLIPDSEKYKVDDMINQLKEHSSTFSLKVKKANYQYART